MRLTPISEKFVLHWGEMGSRWGVSRTVGQIHALLYLSEQPLPADEICETLSIARSNVSTSLKELSDWGLARVVHVMGDRRDHFEALHDIWDIFRVIAQGRRRREIDPTLTTLRGALLDPAYAKESATARARIKQVHDFLETTTAWVDEMQRLDPATLMKIMKMGSKIQRLLGRGGEETAAAKSR